MPTGSSGCWFFAFLVQWVLGVTLTTGCSCPAPTCETFTHMCTPTATPVAPGEVPLHPPTQGEYAQYPYLGAVYGVLLKVPQDSWGLPWADALCTYPDLGSVAAKSKHVPRFMV